jgi:hypothetical protein
VERLFCLFFVPLFPDAVLCLILCLFFLMFLRLVVVCWFLLVCFFVCCCCCLLLFAVVCSISFDGGGRVSSVHHLSLSLSPSTTLLNSWEQR